MLIQLSEVVATLGVDEVIDDNIMRDVNDRLSFKTCVVNFFDFSNFVNFKQVELAKPGVLIDAKLPK